MSADLDRRERMDEEARDWVVRLGSGDARPEDRAAFEAWLARDAAHAQAYAETQAIWGAFSEMGHLRDAARPAPTPARLTGWRGVAMGAAAAAAAVLALVFVVDPSLFDRGPEHTYATKTAEVRDVTLADGSLVTLGAQSAIEVVLSPEARRVKLTAGQAFFEVSKDASRPFTVEAGETLVRVVGTKFGVRRGAETVDVAVLEGVVEVMRSDEVAERREALALEPEPVTAPQADIRVLTAGRGIETKPHEALPEARILGERRPDAWRDGRLVYDDVALREVIADADRYYSGQIVIANPQVADLRVTAAFDTASVEAMLASLERALPVEADNSTPGRIILRMRANGG